MIRVCDTGTFLLIRCQGGQHFKCISRGIPPLIAPCQAPAYVHAMRKQVSVEYLGAYEHRAETEVRQKTDPCNPLIPLSQGPRYYAWYLPFPSKIA